MGYFRFIYTAQPFYSKFPDVKNESARATKLEGVGRGGGVKRNPNLFRIKEIRKYCWKKGVHFKVILQSQRGLKKC